MHDEQMQSCCGDVLLPTAEPLHPSLYSVNLAPEDLIDKEMTAKRLDTQ